MRTKSSQYIKRETNAECAQGIWEPLCLDWEEHSKDLHRLQQIGKCFTPLTLDGKEKTIRPLEDVTDIFKVKVTDLIYFHWGLRALPFRSGYCKSQLEPFRYRGSASF